MFDAIAAQTAKDGIIEGISWFSLQLKCFFKKITVFEESRIV